MYLCYQSICLKKFDRTLSNESSKVSAKANWQKYMYVEASEIDERHTEDLPAYLRRDINDAAANCAQRRAKKEPRSQSQWTGGIIE